MTTHIRKYIPIRLILLLLGLLSLANVAFMFLVANPTIGFALQAAMSVCLILYAICLPWVSKKLNIILGTLCLIPTIFVLFLFIYGNVSHVDHSEDVVIVLGAGVNGETVSRPLAHRLDAAIDYWNQNPDTYIVTTGGLGNRATITEAEAMARYLIRRGIPQERVLLEDQSTSTYENLVFAKKILDEHFSGSYRAVLITNDFHIYRAVHTARSIGLDVGHVGAYTDWYTWPVNYLREMLAVIQHWFFPGNTYA